MAWYDDWFFEIVHALNLHKPPLSSIFLIFVSIFISFFSAGVTRLLINTKELNRLQTLLKEFNERKSKAIREKDPKLWISVKYHEADMTEVQQSMMMKQIIPQIIISVTFIVFFGILRRSMGDPSLNLTPDRGGIVAILPFRIPSSIPLIGGWFSQYANDPNLSAAGFGFWYFLSAIFTSFLLTRIFGINPRRQMGM
ncbi:MAG: DUF106 domain-containing protein [Methanobacteriota archaeon]|nr:MAG: DUF106 domain-containing protein [Euryarchaeota archaeon]